jgi:predicted RNA-binding protein with PIN domain
VSGPNRRSTQVANGGDGHRPWGFTGPSGYSSGVAREPYPARRDRRPPNRWLVDGMNVIGSRPDRWWNDPDRAVHRLVDSLVAFAGRTGDDVTVVFDRQPPDLEPGPRDGIVVAFARWRGRNAADHEIVQMVSEHEHPSNLNVVTSDQKLAERVRELGSWVTSSASFRKRLLDRSSPP